MLFKMTGITLDKYQDHCNRIFSSSTPSNSKGSRKKANSQILSKKVAINTPLMLLGDPEAL